MRNRLAAITAALLVTATLGGCGDDGGSSGTPTPTPGPSPTPTPAPPSYTSVKLRDTSYNTMAFLSDGRGVFVERSGGLFVGDPAGPVRVSGTVPVFAVGTGGVVDVIPDPDFASNNYLYFSATEGSLTTTVGMTVVRARLGGGSTPTLTEQTVIWRGDTLPTSNNTVAQLGGYLAFRDGYLYIALGDSRQMDSAQDLSTTAGKIIRINRDGSTPADNPFVGRPGARGDIYSYGHRAPRGLFTTRDGRLYETEDSPANGDELNLIGPGNNYGWPLVSEGQENNIVDGEVIVKVYPRHATNPTVTAPVYFWEFLTEPAGLLQVSSSKLDLRDEMLIVSTGNSEVIRATRAGDVVTPKGRFDSAFGAGIIREAPDGNIYVLSEATTHDFHRIERR